MGADQLIVELRTLKIEKGNGELANQLDFAFLFIVDVVKQCSVLLVCGGREKALVDAAFPGCPFSNAKEDIKAPGDTIRACDTLCDVGPLVSRKAQFVPAFAHVLNKGFTCHKKRVSDPDYVDSPVEANLQKLMKAGKHKIEFDENQQYTRQDGAASIIFERSAPSAEV